MANFEHLDAEGTPQVFMATLNREETRAVRGLGGCDLGVNLDETLETLFDVGAVEKCFTVITLLHVQDRRLVDLTVPLANYLP